MAPKKFILAIFELFFAITPPSTARPDVIDAVIAAKNRHAAVDIAGWGG
ncbi:hypothetical protein [Pelagibacterium halotolerans]|nr:hypothetical protein [Pelagibacterium halotolerans]QJR19646.1 hypothetical protein HKM20_15125 [Pelagibacterium halotolerans]